MSDDRNLPQNPPVTVLALESAGSACSAAILRDGQVVAAHLAEMEHGQAEALIPMVQTIMAEAGIGYEDLDLIAAGTGPGSYTGVRVALAAARGLASASGKPLSGVSNFDAVYAAAAAEAPQMVALETRRADLYIQLFAKDGRADSPPSILAEQDLVDLFTPGETIVVAGDAAPRAVAVLRAGGRPARAASGPNYAQAAWIAHVAAIRWARERSLRPAEPVYLRAPDALTVAERAAAQKAREPVLSVASPIHGAVMAALQQKCFDEPWSTEAMATLLGQPGVVGTLLTDPASQVPLGYALMRSAAGEAEILTLGIDPQRRRAGLGRRLLADLIARARTAGAEALFLEVADGNRAARSLYYTAGFREVGRRSGYYRSPRGVEDGLTYRLDLPPTP